MSIVRADSVRSRFVWSLTLALVLAAALRGVFPTADPPWRTTVGVVWHDEGAWVHNARNKALFGSWRIDEWNPVFIAPVFTGLEYLSFEAFGVGVRQARLVSELAGVASVLLLGLGVRRVAGNLAGILAAGLLATNYVYVMYDRAAIMEALMVAFIVASWYCSTRAMDRPAWGAPAGTLAVAAYFTKAAAVFYVGVLVLSAGWSLLQLGTRMITDEGIRERKAALWTLAGLAATMAIVTVAFVLPHWTDYRFYNWQMSVTRKPSYDLGSLLMRLSWFPILHDTFSRMWFEVVVGIVGAWGVLLRWRRTNVADRLLLLWIAVGALELVVHDVGNERRFVFMIPALVALTAIVLGRGDGVLPGEAVDVPRRRVLLFSPLIVYSAYLISGPIGRLPFLYTVRPGVRLSAALALLLGGLVIVTWKRTARFLSAGRWSATAAVALTLMLIGRDVVEFAQWALARSYKNVEASRLLARALPPETLVQGKLANGLSLENRIKPVFIGHEFGNYADRKQRDDVRYILTYIEPLIGYEGSQIRDVLDAYPQWRVVMTFDVAETPSGHDRAALIDKFGNRRAPVDHGMGRAQD
jgi:4-amino-4-deoxy-L-arabinose transferase-like glycosyltransferase